MLLLIFYLFIVCGFPYYLCGLEFLLSICLCLCTLVSCFIGTDLVYVFLFQFCGICFEFYVVHLHAVSYIGYV